MKFRSLAVLLLATACGGEPLVGETFLGTPVFTVRGAVHQMTDRTPAQHGDVRLSLFWIGVNSAWRGSPQFEQKAELDAGLGEYAMTLFDAPSDDATTFSDLMVDGRLGLALVVLYADANGDGTLAIEDDVLLGASKQHVVGWASRAVAAGDRASGLVGTIEDGYRLFEHDQDSECRFVDADTCEGEGGLTEVPSTSAVTLTLWNDPAAVVVPAPKIEQGTVRESIWSTGR